MTLPETLFDVPFETPVDDALDTRVDPAYGAR
jgi:hypothetical protein